MPKDSVKLIAHIAAGSMLRGTQLEGNQFSNTIGNLKAYLSVLTTQRADEEVPVGLSQLTASCENLFETERVIQNMCLEKDQKKNALTSANKAEEIAVQARELEGGDYLLIPGGWQNKSAGHAMIYQLNKKDNGDLHFSIYNSGAGIKYHHQKSSTEKELYHAVLTYEIPAENLQSKHEDFQNIIKQLIEAQVPLLHQKSKISEDYLYKTVFPQFSHLKAERLDHSSSDLSLMFTGSQLSGTCVMSHVKSSSSSRVH